MEHELLKCETWIDVLLLKQLPVLNNIHIPTELMDKH